MMLRIEKLIPPEEAKAILGEVAGLDYVDGRQTAGAEAASAKRNEQISADSPARRALSERLRRAVLANRIFRHGVLPKTVTDFHFSRYAPGMEYGMHLDNPVMNLAGANPVRSDLSMTLFLAAPEDYDGGELVMSGETREIAVKLPPGDAIVYPTDDYHRVNPVTRGTRQVAVCWIQSLVRSAAEREILMQVWQVLDFLHGQQPPERALDNVAFRSLSRARQNLLRMWAET